MPKENEITESTRIPLGVAAALVLVFLALGGWATRLELASARADTRLTKHRSDIDAVTGLCEKELNDVKSDLRVIKCHLKVEGAACPQAR